MLSWTCDEECKTGAKGKRNGLCTGEDCHCNLRPARGDDSRDGCRAGRLRVSVGDDGNGWSNGREGDI